MLLMTDARRLEPAQVERLEKHLLRKPDDQSARLKLVSYYFRKWGNPKLARTRARHIAWFVDNAPDREVLQEPWFQIDHGCPKRDAVSIRLKWMNQTKRFRDNPIVLGNAASAFLFHDFETGIKLLKQAHRLAPHDEQWLRQISFWYSLEMKHARPQSKQRRYAREVLHWANLLLNKHQRMDIGWKLDNLEYCARAAIFLSESAQASDYATRALRLAHRHRTQVPEFCHPTLGLAHLSAGNVASATKQLLSFENKRTVCDLEASLANKLAAHGHRSAVIKYLRRCAQEDLLPKSATEEWIKQLESNRKVDITTTADMLVMLRNTADPWSRVDRNR
jgi:hypothetical protein